MDIFLTLLFWYFTGVIMAFVMVYISNKFEYFGDKTPLRDAILFSIFSYVSVTLAFIVAFIVVCVIVGEYIRKLIDNLFDKICTSKIFEKLDEWFTK